MAYIIAEIGNNHNGNVEKCLQLFESAYKAGASAVKIQSFTGQDIISPNVKSNLYPSWDSKGFEYWHEFLRPLPPHE